MKQSLHKDKKGFSMIQVLVAAGITSILSLGVVQMIENTRIAQRRTSLLNTLTDMQYKIKTQLTDQGAFAMTVNSNSGPPFAQLKASALVTENALTNPYEFILFDSSNYTSYDLLGPSDTTGPYNGFTERGAPCTTFYVTPGSGRDDCPFSYRLLVAADCPRAGYTSCQDPQLRFVARLVYNPSNSQASTLHKFRGVVATVSGYSIQSTSEAGVYNKGKFDVEVNRTVTSVARGFVISASVSATPLALCSSGASTTTGGGTCSTGAPAVHPLTATGSGGAGWEKDSDPNNLVTLNTASGWFTFNETGFYKCVAMAKGFSTILSISIFNGTLGNAVVSATSVAIGLSEADARIDSSFDVDNTAHRYYLYQSCSSNATLSCSLGFAKTGYAADTRRLVSIGCEKLDTAY